MTGLACLAFESARRLARLTATLTAMASDVLQGAQGHFDDRIFALKPHPGQRTCARWIREDIEYDAKTEKLAHQRLQDRYSVRCAPHIIGVLLDALPYARQVIETEVNSVNDNPICDPVSGRIHNGGNFYGGHICFVMDGLKNAVANLADLLDRQLALLCNPVSNMGLPANLAPGDAAAGAQFGFKAMQITTSALAAEALKLTVPASVFSRSTENHNQDKVSMGTIAARDCLRIVELTETVAAIHLLGLCQAADLRSLERCHRRTRAMHQAVRRQVPALTADRAMDTDIQTVLDRYRAAELPIGELDWA